MVVDVCVKNIFFISLPSFRQVLWAEWIRVLVDMLWGHLYPDRCVQRSRGSYLQVLLWCMSLPCGVLWQPAKEWRWKVGSSYACYRHWWQIGSYQDCNSPSVLGSQSKFFLLFLEKKSVVGSMWGYSVSPSFLLLCSSKEHEDEKHGEWWVRFLVWLTLSGCDLRWHGWQRASISLLHTSCRNSCPLEAAPFGNLVTLCYEPYKIYFKIFVSFYMTM